MESNRAAGSFRSAALMPAEVLASAQSPAQHQRPKTRYDNSTGPHTMELTHILVDFENLQPRAKDVELVRGDHLRLWIFRGPQQKKFDAELVEALQPLGENVKYIRCEKAGRNALDMHVAFHLGLLLREHEQSGAARKSVRFVVVSNDTDYEPLLHYIGSLGFAATRVPSIRAAVGAGGAEKEKEKGKDKAGGKAAKAKSAAPAPAAKKTAATKPAAAKEAGAKEAGAKPAAAAKQPRAAKKATASKSTAAGKAQKTAGSTPPAPPPAKTGAPDLVEKYIEHLRSHPKNRPSKRKKLEAHVASSLRGKVDADAVPDLVSELERRGVVAITGTKVEYPLWSEAG
jgi:hypothetical protein